MCSTVCIINDVID